MQVPRVSLAPRAFRTDGPDATFLAGEYGLHLDLWQASTLSVWCGVLRNGRPAAPRCGLACPRQNGKNGILEAFELFAMVILGRRILHTAHEVKTARKAFLRILSFFTDFPDLAAKVATVRQTNGQEAIYLTNGGSIEFIARSKSSGRGFSVDILVCDEAQELNEEEYAALSPTISVSPFPQTIMTGTPPEGSSGEVFSRMRADGLEGRARRLAWQEWSCTEDVDLDDPDSWAQANPTLGIRLDYTTVQDERDAWADSTFARERLGVWETITSNHVIEPKTWKDLGWDPEVEGGEFAVVGDVRFAADVKPDRSVASITVAGRNADGIGYVELIRRDRGTGWVAEELDRLCEEWDAPDPIIDPIVAGSIVDQLRELGRACRLMTAREVAQACAGFYDAVQDGTMRHYDQAELNSAIGAASKRNLSDGFAWNRKDPAADISPLMSASLALWGLTQKSKKRKRTGNAVFV